MTDVGTFASAPNNHRKLPINIDLNRDEVAVHNDIRNLVRDMLSLPQSEATALTVKIMTGGLTNRLFLVENPSHPEYHVIVRFFGEGTHEFIDRHGENMVFSALSDHKFGPKFEGLFENGRVEGYIHGRALSPAEMSQPSVYRTVANIVHKLHTLHLPEFFTHQRTTSLAEGSMPQIHPDHTQANRTSPWIWQKIQLFFSLVDVTIKKLSESSTPEDVARLERYHSLGLDKMLKESQWLQHKIEQIISQLAHHMHYHDHVHGLKAPDGVHDRVSMRDKGMAFGLEEVLCHNDLLSGNLMVTSNSPFLNPDVEDNSAEVRLIDYEYAAYNYRCYDLANHFCEFAGFDFDVKDFPDGAIRRDFIKSYLETSRVKDMYDDEFVDGFENMVLLMTLLSCLFWGTWAVVQAGKDLGIDFDYLSYAKRRFDGYFFFKEEFDLEY